jgi:hypothetical protein
MLILLNLIFDTLKQLASWCPIGFSLSLTIREDFIAGKRQAKAHRTSGSDSILGLRGNGAGTITKAAKTKQRRRCQEVMPFR